MMLAMLIMLLTSWLGVRATARGAERTFRALHLVSSATYSIGHGLNDAQKTMGIITVLLYSTGYLSGDFEVPHWVAISCYVAIGLGTLVGRLADHRDDGHPHHQAVAAPGVQRIGRRLGDADHRFLPRHSRSPRPTPSPAA